MKLIPIEKKRVPIGKGLTQEYIDLINDFLDSDMESARIEDTGDVKCDTLYNGLKRVVGKNNFRCRVVKAGHDIYLVRI